jgi:adenosylcobinamide hydrolase
LGEPGVAVLVWRLGAPMRAVSSTVLGGGVGERSWIINAQVPADYARTDPASHLRELAQLAGCEGDGIGFLTAARVGEWSSGHDGAVDVYATVGLRHPVWAAGRDDAARTPPAPVGTINLVVFAPVVLTDAALVNAVTTVTEAKTQALLEQGIEGTGTASDAVGVLCPIGRDPEPFAGPRAAVGAAIARATHRAVTAGSVAWAERHGASP